MRNRSWNDMVCDKAGIFKISESTGLDLSGLS